MNGFVYNKFVEVNFGFSAITALIISGFEHGNFLIELHHKQTSDKNAMYETTNYFFREYCAVIISCIRVCMNVYFNK